MMISLNMACLESGWSIRSEELYSTAGNRRDIEQIGASLTTTNDVLGRACFVVLILLEVMVSLTNINLSNVDRN
jgi:hypothetical protein